MAEEIQVDSDAGAQSQPGVGEVVDKIAKALYEVNPNWAEDGHGIRGPQRQVVRPISARPHRMDFKIDNLQRNTPSSGQEGITVQTGTFSGGYAGTVNGVTTITLDERYFQIQDNGGGEVLISLKTTNCDS